MGETTNHKDNAHYEFFFAMLLDIKSTFPNVYGNSRSNKPHSQGYRDFGEKWGALKTLYEICDEKIEKVREVYQIYLMDYLQYLSYLIDKQQADEEEDKFQETQRELMRKVKGR